MLWLPGSSYMRIVSNKNLAGCNGITNVGAKGVVLPPNASASTYGAVTEVLTAGSNLYDSWGIEIALGDTAIGAGVAGQAVVDILIGGATDDVLISSLICGNRPSTSANTNIARHGQYFFPIHIPAGVRIAARHANISTSVSAAINIFLYSGGVPPFRVGRKVTTYGTKIDDARGKAVTPAASGGTGSVTEMTASCTEDHFAFMVGFQTSTDSTMAQRVYNIGVGSGASVEERLGTWWFSTNANENSAGPFPWFPAFRHVPSGTRLTLLASNSGTNDLAYDGLIYAVS